LVNKVAAIWVLRRDGTALLQHRDNKPGLKDAGLWVPPGGHAESGESMLDCARRELQEETEYEALDLSYFKSRDHFFDDGETHRVSYFWCWYDETQTVVCHEGQGLEFINRSAAAEYPMPLYMSGIWDAAIAAAAAFSEI